jgi:hypothetical protein
MNRRAKPATQSVKPATKTREENSESRNRGKVVGQIEGLLGGEESRQEVIRGNFFIEPPCLAKGRRDFFSLKKFPLHHFFSSVVRKYRPFAFAGGTESILWSHALSRSQQRVARRSNAAVICSVVM